MALAAPRSRGSSARRRGGAEPITTCENRVPKTRSTLCWVANFSTTSAPRLGSVPSSSTIDLDRPAADAAGVVDHLDRGVGRALVPAAIGGADAGAVRLEADLDRLRATAPARSAQSPGRRPARQRQLPIPAGSVRRVDCELKEPWLRSLVMPVPLGSACGKLDHQSRPLAISAWPAVSPPSGSTAATGRIPCSRSSAGASGTGRAPPPRRSRIEPQRQTMRDQHGDHVAGDDRCRLQVPDAPMPMRPPRRCRRDTCIGRCPTGSSPARTGSDKATSAYWRVDRERRQVVREMVGERDRHDRPDEQPAAARREPTPSRPAAGRRHRGAGQRRRADEGQHAGRQCCCPTSAERPGNSSGLTPLMPSQKKVLRQPVERHRGKRQQQERRRRSAAAARPSRACAPGQHRPTTPLRPSAPQHRQPRHHVRKTPTGTRRAGASARRRTPASPRS